VDKLITVVAAATEYEEMAAGVRAIDRIMRRDLFIIPIWYNPSYWVAYFDMYDHPEVLPPYSLGHLDFWWYDAEGAEALRAAGVLR
jgi:microcin C transport system substrate-binding protein